MSEPRFDSAAALAPLKSFQRNTVDYVVRRLYDDPDHIHQFLVADEVGLGKTMVARGVIARAIERMWDSVDRIDIIYICSNQAIAGQNLNRLNVLGRRADELPTRMTLLPLQLRGERGLMNNKVNFVSLTPGTSFDLRSATGVARERALLLRLLDGIAIPSRGAKRLLQVGCTDANWQRQINNVTLDGVDETLVRGFRAAVEADEALCVELLDLCERFRLRRPGPSPDDYQRRNRLIGRLRECLSHICVSALEPDLIILDEFQRFPELLHGDTDAAILAQQMFNFSDEMGNRARTLLLSATPYRMLTLSGDDPAEGDHYKDFLETLEFLYGKERGEEVAGEIDAEMRRFRSALLGLPNTMEEAARCRDQVEGRLRKVIARTERVDSTVARDAMLAEPQVPVTVAPEDLREVVAVAAVARAVGAPMSTEYWKSAPYLLNFMRDYVLKRQIKGQAEAPNSALMAALKAARSVCLDHDAIDRFDPILPANGRMRALIDDVFSAGLAERLWIPPSVPYYGDVQQTTKALVFSSWSMVPDAISALLSYEAERRMGVGAARMRYFEHRRPRLLQFREDQGRFAGLRALLLLYPSPVLAEAADPLRIMSAAVEILPYESMREAVAERLRPHAKALVADLQTDGEAATWDWAGPAILDARAGNEALPWIMSAQGLRGLASEESYGDHVEWLHQVAMSGRAKGHAAEEDVLELMVDLALGSPAICALRALRRVAPDLGWDSPDLLSAAAHIAWGFRTLYNQHDAIALLRQGDGDYYWRTVLAHGARHNLQAVMDEYVHVLTEAEGLTTSSSTEKVAGLSRAIAEVLSLRPSQIEVDDLRVEGERIDIHAFHMRGRFAMRLSDYRDEEGGQARVGTVRAAFNSPFKPFVLASTSIGQEGLDFHPYCHRVYHWNLPGNPVDLEQREGRVHRYKGHAVRRNVAADHAGALQSHDEPQADPWAAMFAAARASTDADTDLVPYWIYEGPVKVERRVLAPPFSREVSRLAWLKRSVAVYRLAFGQPRQDDLLAYLERVGEAVSHSDLAYLQIRLTPET